MKSIIIFPNNNINYGVKKALVKECDKYGIDVFGRNTILRIYKQDTLVYTYVVPSDCLIEIEE